MIALSLLCAPNAHAGTWVVTYNAAGSYTFQSYSGLTYGGNWQNTDGGYTLGDQSGDVQATVSGTDTATLTWTHGQGQNDQNDPPPQTVWVLESGSAFWYLVSAGTDDNIIPCSADDGLGDPPELDPTIPPGAEYSDGDHLVAEDGSSGTVTLSDTLFSQSPPGSVSFGRYGATVGVGLTIQPVDLEGHSTLDNGPPVYPNNPPWDPSAPRFFSGTYCRVVALPVSDDSYLLRVQLWIGGTVVKEYDDTSATQLSTDPQTVFTSGTNQISEKLMTYFDSTHFASGSSVPVLLKVWYTSGSGSPFSATLSANAVNNAYLLYNSGDTVFDPRDPTQANQAKPAADNVNTLLSAPTSHIAPYEHSDDADTINQRLSSTHTPLSPYTIFFAATHTTGAFGDLPALGDGQSTPDTSHDWLTQSTIKSDVQTALQDPNQPPYNFVYNAQLRLRDGVKLQ